MECNLNCSESTYTNDNLLVFFRYIYWIIRLVSLQMAKRMHKKKHFELDTDVACVWYHNAMKNKSSVHMQFYHP